MMSTTTTTTTTTAVLPWNRERATAAAQLYAVRCAAIEDVAIEEGAFDHTVTDPPYADRTQSNTRRGKQNKAGISEVMPLGFDPATAERRARWARVIATATRRFALVFSDHESSMDWAQHLEAAGMEYLRSALWIRTGDVEITADRLKHSGAPQFTGDRPAAGHVVIVAARARAARRVRWNGHGRAAIYTAPVVPSSQRMHTTQKPLQLMDDLLRDFCNPGETILDPFAGSGTTLVAAKLRGIACAGIELAPKFATFAARRAATAGAVPTTATRKRP